MYYTITLCVAPGSTKSSFNFAPPIFLSQKQRKKKFSSIGTENGTPSAQMNVGKHHPPQSPTPWSPLPTLPKATSPPIGGGWTSPKKKPGSQEATKQPNFPFMASAKLHRRPHLSRLGDAASGPHFVGWEGTFTTRSSSEGVSTTADGLWGGGEAGGNQQGRASSCSKLCSAALLAAYPNLGLAWGVFFLFGGGVDVWIFEEKFA